MTANQHQSTAPDADVERTTTTTNRATGLNRVTGTSRRRYLSLVASTSLATIAGCTGGGSSSDGQTEAIDLQPAGEWASTPLTDVRTEEEFTINDFAGSIILVEFFAVWCPVCTSQQEEIEALHADQDDFVSISLNTDPNEDASKVREHLDRNGFDWRYAIAPTDMTEALVDQFSNVIATPPKAPVVLLCPDQQAALLREGVKPASELAASATNAC